MPSVNYKGFNVYIYIFKQKLNFKNLEYRSLHQR